MKLELSSRQEMAVEKIWFTGVLRQCKWRGGGVEGRRAKGEELAEMECEGLELR